MTLHIIPNDSYYITAAPVLCLSKAGESGADKGHIMTGVDTYAESH